MKSLFQNIITITVLISLFGCSTVNNGASLPIKRTEVISFDPIVTEVASLNAKYGEKNTLIVLDIDNTLLTSTIDIGGDIWYQWQTNKLEVKPSEAQKVKCLFQDSIGLLYELAPMELTENSLPEKIQQWQSGGNSVFALTSRAPKYRAATERELSSKGIDFEASALSPKGDIAPIYREVLKRELSYMKGIMMTSGMNKGEMLSYILEKTARHFNAIVFVDDSEKNISNVYEEFKSRTDIDSNLFHYVKIENDRKSEFGSVLTASQAEKMAKDWAELNKVLNAIFPKRELTQGCLSQ
ncbi:MAG: hypothetical protein ACI8PV_000490 [Dinoroseobacter sp.]|jgi:hypothetical protein